jgi:uncharacterized protein YndB with AHSA1/START domain
MMIVYVLVALIAALLIYASTKPDSFRLERSTAINAPPEKVFPLVNDFHAWTQWSPWEKIDADLKRDYSGAPAGKGAIYGWEGKKTGKGRMEIVESVPSSKVLLTLDFIAPMKANNMTEFTFTPNGQGGTVVNWAMYGPSAFVHKIMQVFMSMDAMVGKSFETGLANMKAAAEK